MLFSGQRMIVDAAMEGAGAFGAWGSFGAGSGVRQAAREAPKYKKIRHASVMRWMGGGVTSFIGAVGLYARLRAHARGWCVYR